MKINARERRVALDISICVTCYCTKPRRTGRPSNADVKECKTIVIKEVRSHKKYKLVVRVSSTA